ncbi:MAG: HvfC/BufC family peptide modification chaperone [Burkholderiales bacterium]
MMRTESSSLARFQAAFARALAAPEAIASLDPDLKALCAQPAFAVYRNTFMKACIDALQANYPAVTRLVGEEWFRAAAACFVRQSPPSDPVLLLYAEPFAQFLARFEPAAELPYLPDVARLDRCWSEAHAAAAAEPLAADALANVEPPALAQLRLVPLPSARWAWFDAAPVFTIWSRNRTDTATEGPIEWHGEGALILRPDEEVRSVALGAGGCAFLDACSAGRTLAEAAHAATMHEDGCDLAALLSNLLCAGAFAALPSTDH